MRSTLKHEPRKAVNLEAASKIRNSGINDDVWLGKTVIVTGQELA